MSRFSLLLVTLLFTGVCTYAQKPAGKTVALPKKLLLPQAYIGKSDFKGGPIKRDDLCTLLKQGITSRDSTGKTYKVAGFEFAYSERMIYEDSLGNLMPVNDYMSEYCPGDTLTAGIAGSIYYRIKPGDTLYINRVTVFKASGNGEDNKIMGAGIKCIITK